MRKLLIAAAAGLMTLSALPVAAATTAAAPQERPYMQDNMRGPGPDRGRPDNNNSNNGRGPDRGPGHNGGPDSDRYGRWDSGWGMRPPAPPRHWSRQNDWYRHVRACSQRYRSYNPRTDMFVVSRGRTAMCRL